MVSPVEYICFRSATRISSQLHLVQCSVICICQLAQVAVDSYAVAWQQVLGVKIVVAGSPCG